MNEGSCLTGTDLLGYNFEMPCLDRLEIEGFGDSITYQNPRDQYQWKRTRGKGIDAQITICEYTIDIEFSYMSNDYWYREQWFTDSRIPRFRNSQDSNQFHLNVIVANRPQNYDSVKYLAHQSCGGIFILSLEQLIELLKSILLRYKIEKNPKITNRAVSYNQVIDNNSITINIIEYSKLTCMHQDHNSSKSSFNTLSCNYSNNAK
jgi:hypothetical protein